MIDRILARLRQAHDGAYTTVHETTCERYENCACEVAKDIRELESMLSETTRVIVDDECLKALRRLIVGLRVTHEHAARTEDIAARVSGKPLPVETCPCRLAGDIRAFEKHLACLEQNRSQIASLQGDGMNDQDKATIRRACDADIILSARSGERDPNERLTFEDDTQYRERIARLKRQARANQSSAWDPDAETAAHKQRQARRERRVSPFAGKPLPGERDDDEDEDEDEEKIRRSQVMLQTINVMVVSLHPHDALERASIVAWLNNRFGFTSATRAP